MVKRPAPIRKPLVSHPCLLNSAGPWDVLDIVRPWPWLPRQPATVHLAGGVFDI